MGSKFALVIANTEYTDPGLAQLTAPGQDAKELVRVLDSPDLCAFNDVIILVNENSLKVSETIEYFFSMRTSDDLLMMYFSGHGVRDEYGSLFLAVRNTNRERLRSTAIKADFIREAMDQSRSKRQILILDCCNSGAFAQGSKAEIGGSIGTAKAFEGTGYGRVVLTASDSTQFAWEGDKVIGKEITNSLFTHFLVKGLEGEADLNWDGKITIDDLYDYAYDQVIRHTPKQTPGKWAYKQQGEIYLRENLRPKDVKPAPLPAELLELTSHHNSGVRKTAVQELASLLDGKHLGLARSAEEKLREMAETDDSLTLRKIAIQSLTAHGVETVEPAPVEIQKEGPVEKPVALPPVPPSPEKESLPTISAIPTATDVQPLPQSMPWKWGFPKLNKRLVGGILGVAFGIILLAGAARLIFSGGVISESTPTATATLTRTRTSTPAAAIIAPSLTDTLTPTSTLTKTATPTLTPTATPTRTLIPPTATKRKRDNSSPVPRP